MTVTIEIAGRSLGIAPYMLGELEQAADFIDEMNDHIALQAELERENEEAATRLGVLRKDLPAADTKQPRFKQMMRMLRVLVEVLAVGTVQVDPEMTADAIMKQVDLTFMNSLQTAVFALLATSGFARTGEEKAPPLQPATDGAPALEAASAE